MNTTLTAFQVEILSWGVGQEEESDRERPNRLEHRAGEVSGWKTTTRAMEVLSSEGLVEKAPRYTGARLRMIQDEIADLVQGAREIISANWIVAHSLLHDAVVAQAAADLEVWIITDKGRKAFADAKAAEEEDDADEVVKA